MDADAYAAAQQKSYAGQQTTFAFPADDGIIEVPLGFQPLGISILGSTVAIADYFGPSVLLAEVSLLGRALQFSNIRWIRSTIADGKRMRMFPDLYQPGGANRMQAVVMYSPKRLGLVRNGDRQIFDIVFRDDGEWEHVPVPPERSGGIDAITSVVLVPGASGGFVMLEVNETGTCALRDYRGAELKEKEIAPNRYGIAVKKDGTVATIADFRAKEHGLFFDDKMQVPGLVGNGVVFLDDGNSGALVTRYGQAYPGPFNGAPGALIYVPPRLLE